MKKCGIITLFGTRTKLVVVPNRVIATLFHCFFIFTNHSVVTLIDLLFPLCRKKASEAVAVSIVTVCPAHSVSRE